MGEETRELVALRFAFIFIYLFIYLFFVFFFFFFFTFIMFVSVCFFFPLGAIEGLIYDCASFCASPLFITFIIYSTVKF